MIKKNNTPKSSGIFMGGISCLRLQFRRQAIQVRADGGRNLDPARRFATNHAKQPQIAWDCSAKPRECAGSLHQINAAGEQNRGIKGRSEACNSRKDTKSRRAAKIERYVEPNIGV